MTIDTVTNNLDSGVGSLRAVLNAAAPGDTIEFATTLSSDTISLQSSLVIDKNLTIDGTEGTSQIAISGSALATPLVVQGGTVTVKNAELELGNGTGTDGTATTAPTGGAGAILLSGGLLTLDDMLLTQNTALGGTGTPETASAGGGAGADAGTVLVTGGSLVVQNSTLDGNTAIGGMGGGSPTYDSPFTAPAAGANGGNAAGGIFVEAGTVTVINTTIGSNVGVGGTGGRGGSGYPGSESGGAGGGVGGNAAGVFYDRGGSLFVGGNAYGTNTGHAGDGGMGGYGGGGHFGRNGTSYNNGGGAGGFGGSVYSPNQAGYSGGAGQAYYPYAGLTVGPGGAGGAQGAIGSFGGAGSHAGGGGGGGGGGAGLGSSTSLGVPAQPVACFAAGTRLLTASGEVAVEHLRVGDRVVGASGVPVPVVWIGHRRVDCRRHPRPHDLWPVRVRAEAFGPGQPLRDLLLSPDHAVHVAAKTGGILIPIRHLINDATIVQEPVDTISYWHVELPAHGVLLAEGLPAESYLDTGNRAAFENGGVSVMGHTDFAMRVWETEACAKLVPDGPDVVAVRERLHARAGQLGWTGTDEPAPLLFADGRCIVPQGSGDDAVTFVLPPDCAHALLLSRTSVPAHWQPRAGDTRRLGLAVCALTLDGTEVRLDDRRLGRGWHTPEAGLRWTDGAARIALGGEQRLAVRFRRLLRYWTAPLTPTLRHRTG